MMQGKAKSICKQLSFSRRAFPDGKQGLQSEWQKMCLSIEEIILMRMMKLNPIFFIHISTLSIPDLYLQNVITEEWHISGIMNRFLRLQHQQIFGMNVSDI